MTQPIMGLTWGMTKRREEEPKWDFSLVPCASGLSVCGLVCCAYRKEDEAGIGEWGVGIGEQ